jgi:hypothetical protein
LKIKDPGHHNANDEALQNAMQEKECNFCEAGILALVEGWKKTVEKVGDCIEK